MKILSIGNSFSQDAQRYIHKMSVLNANPIKTVNLYIGGCALRTHYFNMLENAKKYDFQFNGDSTKLPVTIEDALMSDSWDYVTFQQASHYSNKWESYEPYISKLSEYVSIYAPQAKQIIHQTWQYSEELISARDMGNSAEEMFNSLRDAYEKAASTINASGIIPSGALVAALIKNGITAPHRDGYHLSLGAGRLAAGLLWYSYFTGANPYDVILPETDAPITDAEIKIIRDSVYEVI